MTTPQPTAHTHHRSPAKRSRAALFNPFSLVARWAEWFESRGVYVPGEEHRSLSPSRDFGWLIAAWLFTVSALVVLFAVAT